MGSSQPATPARPSVSEAVGGATRAAVSAAGPGWGATFDMTGTSLKSRTDFNPFKQAGWLQSVPRTRTDCNPFYNRSTLGLGPGFSRPLHGQPTAVHHQRLAGDVAARLAGQQQHRADQLLRIGP